MNRYLIRLYFKNGEKKEAYLDSNKEMFYAPMELFEAGVTSVQLTTKEGTYITFSPAEITFVETLAQVEGGGVVMLTKESVEIRNDENFKFRLEMNDIKGIIRLTTNKLNNPTTRITSRNIPITENIKWQFHNKRSGYYDKKNGDLFTGSYISRANDKDGYTYWKEYIVNTYKILKNTVKVKDDE